MQSYYRESSMRIVTHTRLCSMTHIADLQKGIHRQHRRQVHGKIDTHPVASRQIAVNIPKNSQPHVSYAPWLNGATTVAYLLGYLKGPLLTFYPLYATMPRGISINNSLTCKAYCH